MIVGRFDRRIVLMQPTMSQNLTNGESVVTYANTYTCAAQIDNRTNTEPFDAMKRYSGTNVVFLIRQNPSISPNNTWQLQYEGVNYNITGISEAVEFGRGRAWRVVAERKV